MRNDALIHKEVTALARLLVGCGSGCCTYDKLSESVKATYDATARTALKAVLPSIIRRSKRAAWEEGKATALNFAIAIQQGHIPREPANPYEDEGSQE